MTASFGTPLIGQTEKALNAILRRQLAGTGLSEQQWITLSLIVAAGGTIDGDELTGRVAGVLQVSTAHARARITELAAAQFLQPAGNDGSHAKLTDAGQRLHRQVRTAVSEITERLWGDLPAEDIASAGRVLSTVLERANAELAKT
jgi:DNA-binding MarR family transcriptional regulator